MSSSAIVSVPRRTRSGVKEGQSVKQSPHKVPPSSSTSNASRRSGAVDKRKLETCNRFLGDFPPLNSDFGAVADIYTEQLYFFGGIRPGDTGDNKHTSDFYSLDLKNMRWKNLTNLLRHRNPSAPFSREECDRKTELLPPLGRAGDTLFRRHGQSFVLLWGGYKSTNEINKQLLVINVTRLEWWWLDIEGGPVIPRIQPAVVAIQDKIYVFGGYRKTGVNPDPIFSYSIASLPQDGSNWKWDARDVEYPPEVRGLSFLDAVPIYNGRKLLLMADRRTEGQKNLSQADTFTFHVQRQKFQPIDVDGTFPQKMMGYFAWTAVGTSQFGHPLGAGMPLPSPDSHSSVHICAWVPKEEDEEIFLPELWRLSLTPIERIECLQIRQRVDQLEHAFHVGFFYGQQLILMGCDPKDKDDEDIYMDSESDVDDADLVLNIYYPISIPPLP